MLERMLEIFKAVADNDELFALHAKIHRKMYDALIKEGFKPEEALQIVITQGTMVKAS